jgi:hypothetical protein
LYPEIVWGKAETQTWDAKMSFLEKRGAKTYRPRDLVLEKQETFDGVIEKQWGIRGGSLYLM